MSDAPPPFDSAQPFETMTAPAFDPSKPFSPFKAAEPEEELKLPPAITDIPHEIAAEAKAGASDVAGVMNRGKMGTVEALTSIPKAILGAGRVLASPVTGAISSVGGHALANVERGFGEHVVNPLMEHFGYKAQHPDEAEMYETAKGDVNKAMMGARPYGATIKPPGLMTYEPKLLEPPGTPLREPTPPPAPEPPMQEPPRQTLRPDAGVDLLPPDVPHTPRSDVRIRSLSAAGPGGPLSDISPETQTYLRKIMEDQGLNQNTLDDRLADMSAHHFFGEITPSLESDMGAIAAPPGPGKQEVLGSIRQRGAEKLERLQNTFDRAFGQNENVAQLNRLIDIDKQKAAAPLYQQFRQTVIPPSPGGELERIIPRLRASGALQAANKALAEEGLPASMGFGEGEHATQVPTAAAFDYAKQHLDGLINSALKNEDAGAVRRYTKMKNDLDAALDAHPTAGRLWQQAREAYGGPTARQDAMKFGQRVLTNHVGADELPFLTAGYNDAQMQALRVGMRKFLEDKLGSRREVSADIFTSTLSPNNVQKIRWAIGDQAADELVTGMHHELHMHGAPTRIHGGSPTAHRLEAQKRWTVQPAPEGLTSDLGIKDAFHPGKTAARKAVEAVTKMGQAKKLAAAEAKAAKLREEAARVFTLQGPERDAVARHLLGGAGGTPRARGGRVSVKKTAKVVRASGGAVGRAIRASKGYAEGGAPELSDDDQAAMMPETFMPEGVRKWTEQAAPKDYKIIRNNVAGLASLPERAIRSAEHYQQTGEYDPAPIMEAATLPMGTGAISGVGLRAGETALGSGLIKRSTEIPNIRELPAQDAIMVARTEPHLIKAGDQSEGYYIGGPRDIQSKRGLTNLRNRFDDYVAADPRGGDWYDRYRNSVADVTGNDPLQNKWMSNQEGQWSAGVSPEGELGFALKENNASLAGMPVKSARPAQHIAHERAIEAQDPARYQLGDKTGEYASLINPDRPKPPGATGVNDFRHARNFDYTEAGPLNMSASTPQRNALTAAQHKFLDYETALAVDRANKANLGGRSNWTGEQLQAAPWVRQKALDLMSRNEKLSYDDAFARANTTIGDFFDKHTAFATHEAMPGADTGHLSGSIGAPSAEREAFAADPRSTWATAPGGRDAIYGGMGIEGTGNYMRVRPTTEMQGLYTPPGGATEANPGWTARPLVAFDSGKAKTVAPADQALLNAGEATRGYVDAQNASAWHKPWAGGAPGESNSLFMPMEGKATPEQLTALQRATAPHGLPDIADTGKGITATSFWPPPGDIGKALKPKGGLLDAIQQVLPGAEPKRVKVDSNLIDYVPKWQEGVGSGAATRELLEHITKTPRLKAAMTNNPNIAKAAIDRLERDQEWASKWGAPREDIQNARRIIGGGTGWVERLETALKKGALLPAAAIAVFGTAALQEHGRS